MLALRDPLLPTRLLAPREKNIFLWVKKVGVRGMSREVKDRTVYQLIRVDKPDDGTEIYVGSTSRRHWRRLREHKSATKGGGAPPFHETMREVGVGNWKITPLVTLKCDKLTIRKLERE